MEVPRSYIGNYADTLEDRIIAPASEELAEMLGSIDFTRPIAEIRDEVIAIMDTYCGSAAEMSARVSAEFYDGLRERTVGRPLGAYVESGRDPAATEGAVRAFVQGLVDGKPVETFVGKCSERLRYEAKRAAGTCIERNARRDELRPRYARVPSGVDTCDFCIMLASRGPVYRSAQSAGMLDHWHANCDCRIVPGFGKKPTVDGYDPDHYYDQYEELGMRERMRLYRAERGLNSRSVRSERLEQYMEQSAARRARNLSDAVDWIEDAQTVDELRERMGLLNDNLASMGISNEDSVKRLNAVLRRRRREIESAN